MADRVKAAQAEALRRFRHEGRQLAPLRFWVIAIVVVVGVTSKPTIGASGRHLALAICLAIFAGEMLLWPIFRSSQITARLFELSIMGASAIALSALQPNGVSELPSSAVVFCAGITLAPAFAIAISGAITIGIVVSIGSHGHAGAATTASSALLCVVLGVTGGLLRRYRLSQERTELLFAELEEARDDQERAAAAEERASIARDLHDVLAHSLSGLSIQLEVARKIAASTDAPNALRESIENSASLAKEGLLEARAAVGALRQEEILSLDRLPALVEHFRHDLKVQATFAVDGDPRPVTPELGLALYRVTGESLTNVVRHAEGAVVQVQLSFEESVVRLAVTDEGGQSTALAAEGSGWGLTGVRERVQRLGGELVAGPSGLGWRVVATVPA